MTLTHEEVEARVAQIHAERYPDGCGPAPGHHCERCTKRLGQRMHTMRSFMRGARPGYKGTPIAVCTECAYRSDR